uniref:TGF-beta family profile domain-containing protein n=1 Tax=Spermophilus dauricus TaxID=99837 RepID=A0A8C9UMZ0_SPEDA
MDITQHIQQTLWNHKSHQVLRLRFMYKQEKGSEIPGIQWIGTSPLDTAFVLLYLNDTHKSGQKAELPSGLEEFGERKSLLQRVRQAASCLWFLTLPRNIMGLQIISLPIISVPFIIAPRHHTPNYCKGSCPWVLRYGLNSPNHAIIQNLINELLDKNISQPSCVTYKYAPMSILLIEGFHPPDLPALSPEYLWNKLFMEYSVDWVFLLSIKPRLIKTPKEITGC